MSLKMYLPPLPLLLLLLSLARYSSSQNPVSPPPRGCGSDVAPAYRALCDLEAVWGVVLEGVVCGGILTSLVLSLLLLGRRRYVHDPGQLSGLGPLHLLLASLLGLFSLALAFLVGRSPALCLVRRALWGPLHALCFSSLVTQGVRLKKLVSGRRSPAGGTLAGAAVGLALVQGIVSGEWLLLTVAREGHAACDYPPLDFALVCGFALVLLLVAMTLALAVVLCGGGEGEGEGGEGARAGGGEGEKRRWRCNGVWLFLACLASALLWVGWLGFYLYGDPALKAGARARGRGRARAMGAWRGGGGGAGGSEWDEPALAVALVSQGWVLLLFHAIPETHLCLRSPAQADDSGYHDDGHPTLTRRFPEDTPSSHPLRVYGAENQAFSIEEHSAALRGGAYHNGHGGIRPGIPFRGHVYQPTEMALVMNGGTMPTAPVNFTGRQLW